MVLATVLSRNGVPIRLTDGEDDIIRRKKGGKIISLTILNANRFKKEN